MAVDPNAPPTVPIPPDDPWARLSSFLSATAGSRTNGRFNQAFLNNDRDRTASGLFGTASNNALQGAKFGLDAPNVRAGQSVRGDVMANAQDAEVSGLPDYVHVGKVSGGLRPSLFSENTREFGRGLSRTALLSQMNGGDKVPYPTTPTLTPVPEASALDTALNAGAGAAGLASALKNLGQSGAGGDLKKLFDAIKGKFFGGSKTNGNTGQPTGDFPHNLDDPAFGAFDPTDYGRDPSGNYGPPDPTGSVDTGEFMGQWPEPNGPSGGIDGSQVPGQSDPMAEYLAYLASQGGGGGDGGDNSSDQGYWY